MYNLTVNVVQGILMKRYTLVKNKRKIQQRRLQVGNMKRKQLDRHKDKNRG